MMLESMDYRFDWFFLIEDPECVVTKSLSFIT